MNSGELLRRQLATSLYCERDNILNGAQGPTGPEGPTGAFGIGPTGPASTVTGPTGPEGGGSGNSKSFTIYIDYTTADSTLSRIYIPAGLSTNPAISGGGTFTEDIASVLIFVGLTTISIADATYAIPIGMSCIGYTNSEIWTMTSYGNIGGGRINFTSSSDYTLNISGMIATYVNGGNAGTKRPSSGVLSGWVGALTIYFL